MRRIPTALLLSLAGTLGAACGSGSTQTNPDTGASDGGIDVAGDTGAQNDTGVSSDADTDITPQGDSGGCLRALGGGPSGPAFDPAYTASAQLAYDRACDTTPLPSPNVTTGHPNEPAGFTTVSERPFSTRASTDSDRGVLQPDGTYVGGSEGWDGAESRYPNVRLQSDLTDAPQSAPNGMRFFYPYDMMSGISPGTVQTLQYRWTNQGTNRPLTEVYVSMHIRLSKNWSGNQSNTNKMPSFLGIGDANNNVFFSAEGKFADPLELQWRMQGIADPRARIGTGHFVERGVWEHWEWVARCNSAPNAPDGGIRVWVDGAQVLDVNDVNYTRDTGSQAGAQCVWTILSMAPVFGGGGPYVPHDQWIDVDHVYISGQ